MRKVNRTALSATLLLAACGGSGGPSSGGVPVTSGNPAPTPTPSAAPTPTPSGTPTPTPGPLTLDSATSDQDVRVACEELLFDASTPGTGHIPSRFISYRDAPRTYTINSVGGALYNTYSDAVTFAPADLDASNTTATRAYSRLNPRGGTDRLAFLRPAVAGTTLDYVRTASWSILPTASSFREDARCHYGIQTSATDAPAGIVNYPKLSIDGVVYLPDLGPGPYSLARSSVTFNADNTGRLFSPLVPGPSIVTRIRLVATPSTGPDFILGDVEGTWNIGSDGTFAGNLGDLGSTNIGGSGEGRFYGPARQELAFTFSIVRSASRAPGNNAIRGIGLVLAKR